jgi:N-acetyl-alpha-D-glucosaminyl L-malate synthase BshA
VRATREHLGVERPIEVIPNFVDPARYEHAAAWSAGARRWAEPGESILVHISNFRPVKRVPDVVDVFHRLAASRPVRLLLIGDGPERHKVEARCRELGVCDRILFLGNLPRVEEILVGADLFLLPSETESFGLAALEALACRVPVIASRVGGLPEVVREGETGFLLPVGDVEGMAAAAASLLDDPQRHRLFADRAREDAIERFAMDRIVARYRSLYERTL